MDQVTKKQKKIKQKEDWTPLGILKSKSEIVDFDTHIKILNFLIHIQSMGVIDEKQRCFYSACIQDYLKQRKSNIEFLENVLNEIK